MICPRCRVTVPAEASSCTCGLDLAWLRAELAKLTRPRRPIRWPFEVLQRLSPDSRRELVRNVRSAVESEHAGVDADTRAESDRLLDETVASLTEPDKS